MKLRFAFAVNNDNQFVKKHFGDADKYIIYELRDERLEQISEEINQFKSLDEKHTHGSVKKGNAIINILKKKGVNVLVSMRFGKNIKLINEHFIPVQISLKLPDEVILILNKHLHWIVDEWENNKSDYKLFTIKSGILKSSIEK
jgi:predicted Fe-Mo cluster-binding NifX family protein